MALQGLEALCLPVTLGINGGQLCITIPGAEVGSPTEKFCVTMPSLNFADFDMAKQLIAQLNAALFPYMPYIDAAAALVELFQCVVGILEILPTSVGDLATMPQKIAQQAQCLDAIKQRINAILRALPPYSFLKIVYDATAVIQAGIAGMRNEFAALLDSQLLILQRGLRAARFGSKRQLLVALDCATANLSLQFASLHDQATPLQSFMTVISFLATFAGAATGGGGSMNMNSISAILGQAQTDKTLVSSIDAFREFADQALTPFDLMIGVIIDFRSNVKRALDATQPPQI